MVRGRRRPTLPGVTGPHTAPHRVLVAGGGIAGLETALALREFAGDAVDVTVVDPGRRFTVPGTATARAFGLGTAVDLRLADVVHRAGATLLPGRIATVEPARHVVVLEGGEVLTYDALVVAVGATPVAAVPGALTFRGQEDVEAVRGMVDDVSHRGLRGAGVEMAIVVPAGCGWPLAAYELALMTREHLVGQGGGESVAISVITSEETPARALRARRQRGGAGHAGPLAHRGAHGRRRPRLERGLPAARRRVHGVGRPRDRPPRVPRAGDRGPPGRRTRVHPRGVRRPGVRPPGRLGGGRRHRPTR